MSNELGYLIEVYFLQLKQNGYSSLCASDKIIEEVSNLLEKLNDSINTR